MFTSFTSTEKEKVKKGLGESQKTKKLVLTRKKTIEHSPINSKANIENKTYKNGTDLSKYG